MMSFILLKEDLRLEMLKKRQSLSGEEANLLSGKICENFLKEDLLENYESFGLYMSLTERDKEVETNFLFKELKKRYKKIFFPRLNKEENNLRFFEDSNIDDFEINKFNIAEPKAKNCKEKEALPQVVFCPGIAFNEQGKRVGFGKGYYDRFFEGKVVIKIGLAYSFQVVKEDIKTDNYDIEMDYIVTDKQVIKCKAEN